MFDCSTQRNQATSWLSQASNSQRCNMLFFGVFLFFYRKTGPGIQTHAIGLGPKFHIYKNLMWSGWREGSVVKNVHCFAEDGGGVSSQPQVSWLTTSCNSRLEGIGMLDTPFWPPCAPALMCTCTQIHRHTNN